MDHALSDFLDQMIQDGAIALYLSEGLPPVVALPSRPRDPDLASAYLFAMEIPKLTRERLKTIWRELNEKATWKVDISEFTQLRYKNGPYDLDVFVFANEQRIHMEFRGSMVGADAASSL